MDVDLLRPGTVPISPDTLLWFEFLLDPSLLKKHLEKPTSDPSPSELIVKFITESGLKGNEVTNDVDINNTNDSKAKLCRRSRALKILALKVVAFLNWDLNVLETKLPPGLQTVILQDLLFFVDEKNADPSLHGDLNLSQLSQHVLFAIILYHRWVLRAFSNNSLDGKQNKANGLQQNVVTPEWMTGVEVTEIESERSLKVLQGVISIEEPKPLVVPSFESLVPLTEDLSTADHRWDLCRRVSVAEFHCQVLMDVSNYFIFRESYSSARESLRACLKWFQHWKKEGGLNENGEAHPYCNVTQGLLSASCIAVGIRPALYSTTLTQQFHSTVAEHYMNVTKVFDRDNVMKEIPMLYRDSLELDINSEAASGKLTAHRDGILHIQASNMVRRALEGSAWHKSKVTPVALNKTLLPVISTASQFEKDRLRYFLLELFSSYDPPFARELSEQPCVKHLLTDQEIQEVMETDYTDPIPHVLMSNEIESIPTVRNQNAVAAAVERVLISSYDLQEIRNAILKLMSLTPVIDMAKLNRSWEIPIPIYNVIMTIPAGFLQHFSYILMVKSYELDHMKNYGMARTMLRVVCEEVMRESGNVNMSKFTQLVTWELLLIDIHQFHQEWPVKHMADWSAMVGGCIGVLHKTDGCLPRITLREQCALALLNLGQWQPLISLPAYKHNVPIAELYISIAAACLDLNKYNKKITTDAWDKLLPVFQANQKRRDALSATNAALCSVIELNALALVISLLTKLHNVLSNQPMDLVVHYTQLWPSSIQNSSQYSIKSVSETLFEVLNHALKEYPTNIHWLKLRGDLHFVNNHYSAAIKNYLQAIIASTDYFARPIIRSVLEDHVFKRMIKCCSQLQYHTQAAILCQFTEEVDYTTAFKCLAEGNCSDAMDSYYDCIWDISILEFLINLYSKRGEHYRKQKAVRIIGLLELNANNNEEIKREAENIRKARFLRALAKQYIC